MKIFLVIHTIIIVYNYINRLIHCFTVSTDIMSSKFKNETGIHCPNVLSRSSNSHSEKVS